MTRVFNTGLVSPVTGAKCGISCGWDKEIARLCLDMIRFGMDNTIITFEDQYWIYGGNVSVDFKGLTIGGFE